MNVLHDCKYQNYTKNKNIYPKYGLIVLIILSCLCTCINERKWWKTMVSSKMLHLVTDVKTPGNRNWIATGVASMIIVVTHTCCVPEDSMSCRQDVPLSPLTWWEWWNDSVLLFCLYVSDVYYIETEGKWTAGLEMHCMSKGIIGLIRLVALSSNSQKT